MFILRGPPNKKYPVPSEKNNAIVVAEQKSGESLRQRVTLE